MSKKNNPEYEEGNKALLKSEVAEKPKAVNLETNPIDQEKNQVEEKLTEQDLKEGKLSRAYQYIYKKIVPGVLEGSYQAINSFNRGVDYSADAINRMVPAAAEAVNGFILPENFGRIINKTVEKGTKGATFVGKNVAKAAMNIFTYGAPAWVDAFRQHLAVKEGNEKYEQAESGQDLLAINFVDHIKDEKLRKSLSDYYGARKEMAELRQQPKENIERLSELSEQIANYEMTYKDCVDFSNLKAILEKGQEFADGNEALINQLAEETADRMIANVENFYQGKFGKLGGKVEGKWLGLVASKENGREKLVNEIKERLKTVMSKELDKQAVQMEMKRITGELFSEFGVYRKYFKAAIYTLLREMPVIKSGLEHAGIWGELTNLFHRASNKVGGLAGDIGKKVAEEIRKDTKHLGKLIIKGLWDELPRNAQEYLSAAGFFIEHPLEGTKEAVVQLGSEAWDFAAEKIQFVIDTLSGGHLDFPTNMVELKQDVIAGTLDQIKAAAQMYQNSGLDSGPVPDIAVSLK